MFRTIVAVGYPPQGPRHAPSTAAGDAGDGMVLLMMAVVALAASFLVVRRWYRRALREEATAEGRPATGGGGESVTKPSFTIRRPLVAALVGFGIAAIFSMAAVWYLVLALVAVTLSMVYEVRAMRRRRRAAAAKPKEEAAPSGMRGYLEFGKSKVRIYHAGEIETRFSDVAGIEEAIEEVREVVEFMHDPQIFLEMGARIPRGVLLMGPPGCGKTLLARAIAGEAGAAFLEVSGTEFVEMFVGVGASRVRDLFSAARKNAPAIVFIDEIDAVGQARAGATDGGKESEDTLRQLLREMDGFEKDPSAVVVIGATNAPELLDPALTRAGRFDRKVLIGRPDFRGRIAILKVHCRGKPIGADVDFEEIARQTVGMSGADLANVVNEAAMLAALRLRTRLRDGTVSARERVITAADFAEAQTRTVLGRELRSRQWSHRERWVTAIHEAGHTVVARALVPITDSPRSVSIMPRGMSGGHTSFTTSEEQSRLQSAKYLKAQLRVALGGYAAELEFLGAEELTTGSTDDRERATDIADAMVREYGMALGPRTFGRSAGIAFLGGRRDRVGYSEATAQKIDEAIAALVAEAADDASAIIRKHRGTVEALARKLLIAETIRDEELEAFFKDFPLITESSSSAASVPPAPVRKGTVAADNGGLLEDLQKILRAARRFPARNRRQMKEPKRPAVS